MQVYFSVFGRRAQMKMSQTSANFRCILSTEQCVSFVIYNSTRTYATGSAGGFYGRPPFPGYESRSPGAPGISGSLPPLPPLGGAYLPPQYQFTTPPLSYPSPPYPLSGYPQAAPGGGRPQQPPFIRHDAERSSGPEPGSKEKPLVVVAAPQPTSWFTRIWFFLFLLIAITCALQLYEEYLLRSGDAKGGMPGMGRGGGMPGAMFGNSDVQPVDLEKQSIKFSDVRGCDEAKAELAEIVEFLKNSKKFQQLGARLPKGALLVGPPGTGKTMLAKAIAKEAGVKFYYAVGSEFDEMFVGVGSRRVRDLFTAAKANAPSIVFIDEIDAMGGKRNPRDSSYNRMTLNQLLAEMDGFQASEAVIVLAATNSPESLDAALKRPGRFDTVVTVDPPDMKGREQILESYLSKITYDSSVHALEIARGTSGMTGADLNQVVNLSAIRAAVLNKPAVSQQEIEFAIDRVTMGAENRSKVIPDEEKRITAYHEGAHALVALLLEKEGAEPVHKATIVPRGSGIMGLVQQQPSEDRYSQSRRQLIARLQVCLAGRIGEEYILGNADVTTGASSDFKQATRLARAMVRQFGFSNNLGQVDYETPDTSEGATISEETKLKIENTVSGLIQEAYKNAKQLVEQNSDKLELIAKGLLKFETLSGTELKQMMKDGKLPQKLGVQDSGDGQSSKQKSGSWIPVSRT